MRIVHEERFPSLALRPFLPLSEKDLPTPRVLYVDGVPYGGIYFHPKDEGEVIGQRHIDLSRGALIVSTENFAEDTLAHEWRHHWQFCNGWKYDGVNWPPRGLEQASYDAQVHAYFCGSKSEMDALKWSWRATGVKDDRWEWAIWGQA
jgi:hypothetical protein